MNNAYFKGMTDEEIYDLKVSHVQVTPAGMPNGVVVMIPSCRLGDLESKVREVIKGFELPRDTF